MEVKAEQRYIRMSPRKLRQVADSVRGIKTPGEMLSYLERIERRAAVPLAKVIKQAVANATNNLGLAEGSLRIKNLQIGEGPIYKRFRPVSRGRAHPIQKRTSHIRVILEAEEQKGKGKKAAKKATAPKKPKDKGGKHGTKS